MAKQKGLRPGDAIPDFSLEASDGGRVQSKNWQGRYVLLLFHRGTWCPSCRHELNQFAKHYNQFQKLNVDVFSILGQNKASVQSYLEKHPLPFPVLVDETREVIKAFDVYHPIGIDAFNIARPSVFLISPDQKIVYGYVGRHQADLPKKERLTDTIHQLIQSTVEEE